MSTNSASSYCTQFFFSFSIANLDPQGSELICLIQIQTFFNADSDSILNYYLKMSSAKSCRRIQF